MIQTSNYPNTYLTDIFIDAAPNTVWQVLVDLSNWKTWQPNIAYANTAASVKAGAIAAVRYQSTRYTIEIIDCVEQKLFSLAGSSIFSKMFLSFEVKPHYNGTHVIVKGGNRLLFPGLFRQSRKKMLKKNLITWTTTLKYTSEQQ